MTGSSLVTSLSGTTGVRRLLRARFGLLVAAAFALLLVCQVVLVHEGISGLQAIGLSMQRVVEEEVPAQEQANAMQIAAQGRINLMLRMLAEPDPFEREDDAQAFGREGLAFGAARDRLAALPHDPISAAMMADVVAQAVALSQLQREVVAALLGGEDEQARRLVREGDVLARQRQLQSGLSALAEHHRTRAQQMQLQAQTQQQQARSLLLALGGALFAFGLAIGLAVSRLVARAEGVLRLEGERADRDAHTDPLTGLLNRRGFERARASWSLPAGGTATHSLLLIDLDRFKPVNDEAGHEAGDALLKRLAALIREQARPQDQTARLGGDEFGVLVHGANLDLARSIAERIRHAVAGFVFDWQGRRFSVGASIGIAAVAPGLTDDDWRQSMTRADEACYAAKRQGRNQVCVWHG